MISLKYIKELGFLQTGSGDPNALMFIKDNNYIYIKDNTFIIGIIGGQTLYVGKIENKETLVTILKGIEIIKEV